MAQKWEKKLDLNGVETLGLFESIDPYQGILMYRTFIICLSIIISSSTNAHTSESNCGSDVLDVKLLDTKFDDIRKSLTKSTILRVTGKISPRLATKLSQLPHVEGLDLLLCKNVNQEILEPITTIKTLRHLRVSGDFDFVQMQVFADFGHLESLHIVQSRISSIGFHNFESLINLKELSFKNSWVTYPDQVNQSVVMNSIGKLTGLKSLTLFANLENKGIERLNKISGLEHLSIAGADDVTIFLLNKLKTLQYIDLRNSSITQRGLLLVLRQYRNVRSISLGHAIGEKGFRVLDLPTEIGR